MSQKINQDFPEFDRLIDILYPESTPQRATKLNWTYSATLKYVQFIETNGDIFRQSISRRRSKIFRNASQLLGPNFTCDMVRKRFNTWVKKYGDLENLIRQVKIDLQISKTNEMKLALEAEKWKQKRQQKKRKEEQGQIEQTNMFGEGEGTEKKDQQFVVQNGSISFL